MNQVFGCPSCQQPFQVAEQQAGQVVQCPACAIQVEIPANAFQASPPTPPSKPQVFACPACAGQFGITPEMNGMKVGCPHCQTAVLIEIPEPIDFTAEPPAIKTDKQKPASTKAKTKSSPRWKKKSDASKDSPDLFAPGFKNAPKKHADESVQPKRRSEPKASADLAPPPTRRPLETKTPGPATTPVEKVSPTPADAQVVDAQVVDAEAVSPTDESVATAAGNETPESTETADVVVETSELDDQPDPIDHLLPPLFNVLDPARMRGKAGTEQFKVVLPDGKGGMKQVDKRVVQVEHGGEKVSLVAMTRKEKSRRRMIQNIIAIVIGVIVLGVAFWLLR